MRTGLLKWCVGIFMVILLGLATILITPAGPAVASITSTSPTSSAQTRAAAPCGAGDKTKRYVDCGNGTVADTMTGLIWLKQSNCLPAATWEDAKKAVAGLKNGDCMLTDGSKPGEWRLPTNKEWEATMATAKSAMCSYPTLTDDAGTACIKAGQSSFTDLESDYYWSSTPVEGGTRVYFGDIDHGNILNGDSAGTQRVWPVRGGQH